MIGAIDPTSVFSSATASPSPAPAPAPDVSFRDALAGAAHRERAGGGLREAAEGFVSGTLVLPVLAQLRSSGDAAPPFQPGAYEKAFAPMLDAEIARRIVRSERFAIVDSVVDSLTPRTAPTEDNA